MTDLSGLTPAEQWLSIDIRDAEPGDEAWDTYFKRWTPLTEEGVEFQRRVYSNGKPVRRRIIDPAEPLRRELREAHEIIQSTMDNNWLMRIDPTAWLDRNAAFGGQKGEG